MDADAERGSQPWLTGVSVWVQAALAKRGMAVTEPLRESETRPWSTVWTLGTDRGRAWFKECETVNRIEPAVHRALAQIAPQYVDAPLGVEPERGWLLTSDGGTTLAGSGPAGSRGVAADTIAALLIDYAALQRATMGRQDELRDAGLPAVAPQCAAGTAAAQASLMGSYPVDDPRHLTDGQVQAVLDAGPALTEAAEVLAAGPVPLGFDHADLFPRNVFLPRAEGHPHRFFDFAESVWAHPFGSLVMLMPELRHRWNIATPADALDCRDPRIRAIVDAYLGCWTDLASPAHLRVLAEAALRIAPLHRSTPWLRTLAEADTDVLAAHGRTPWAWLEDVTRPVLL